jgi:hypothetical protein
MGDQRGYWPVLGEIGGAELPDAPLQRGMGEQLD